jgi:hypothetical protein
LLTLPGTGAFGRPEASASAGPRSFGISCLWASIADFAAIGDAVRRGREGCGVLAPAQRADWPDSPSDRRRPISGKPTLGSCPQRRLEPRSPGPVSREPVGAGSGNRTRVFSLEGCCSTIELYPQTVMDIAKADREGNLPDRGLWPREREFPGDRQGSRKPTEAAISAAADAADGAGPPWGARPPEPVALGRAVPQPRSPAVPQPRSLAVPQPCSPAVPQPAVPQPRSLAVPQPCGPAVPQPAVPQPCSPAAFGRRRGPWLARPRLVTVIGQSPLSVGRRHFGVLPCPFGGRLSRHLRHWNGRRLRTRRRRSHR